MLFTCLLIGLETRTV